MSLDQLSSNGAFGGEALCMDKELQVVDFVVGHPDAFRRGTGNCLLYSQAKEAAEACRKDKELNDRIYCVLGINEIPPKPELSDLCDYAPSVDYQFGMFYSCVTPSSAPACELETTTTWDRNTSSCSCPAGTIPCTAQEAKSSDAWADELGEGAQVYLANSIRYRTPELEYEAFLFLDDPCSEDDALALCRRDTGPDCFSGDDQPFYKRWEYEGSTQSEFSLIMDAGYSGVLELENTCANYERFTLVRVVAGHKELLEHGKRILGCALRDITELVKTLLPENFLVGEVRNYSVALKGVKTNLATCPQSDTAYFASWNCTPNVGMPAEDSPISCNLYHVTSTAQDNTHYGCACPNSARPCSANAAAFSRTWIAETPQNAAVSLADYLVYKTPESGAGSLFLVADLGLVCRDTGDSYVLCEGPVCDRAFSTVEGATEEEDAGCKKACNEKADGECSQADNIWLCVAAAVQGSDANLKARRGSLAPDCNTAVSANTANASTSYCKYLCGNIEWRCRFTMMDNPTLYKDLMQCFEELKVGTILESCQVKTTAQTPTAGAANMAVSWMLASGTETTVRFAQPVYPTPIVFIGAPPHITGIPRLAISQVTSESFRVQAFGSLCGVRPTVASSDIKIVASYLAIPPGHYLTKHSPINFVVGSIDIDAPGEFVLRTPFTMANPSRAVVLLEPQSAVGSSPQAIAAAAVFRRVEDTVDGFKIQFACVEPFTSISVGYLIADAPDDSSSTSPLAASLGGRSLAIFNSTDVDLDDIRFPENLPAFFPPHFFPQLAVEGSDGDEMFSVQWQHRDDGRGWVPSVWVSSCSMTEDILYKEPNAIAHFTGIYISAINQLSGTSFSTSFCNVKASQDSPLTDELCAEICSGIYLLYCSAAPHPVTCLEWRMPPSYAGACESPTESNASSDVSGDADTGEGLAVPCSKDDAVEDLTWFKELHEEGGLCQSTKEPVRPVTKMFLQLEDDACYIGMQHASSLTWVQRAYPSYPDLPGAGPEPQSFSGTYLCQHTTPYVLCPADAAGGEEEEGETSQAIKHLPTSCFVGEWGEWSACDATCAGEFSTPQRYRKRSPIVAEVAATDPDCILEEKEACGHSLQPCVGYCWTSDWTEWSNCSAVLSGGEILFAQRRYKPVLAGAEYCNMEAIQDLRSCLREKIEETPEEGEEDEKEEQGEPANAGFAEVKAVAPSSTREMSDWSGCDVPCLLQQGHEAQKRKMQFSRHTGEIAVNIYLPELSSPCTTADGLQECKDLFRGVECNDAVPTYRDPASQKNCVEKCKSVHTKCRSLSSEDALKTPFKSCIVNGLAEAGFFITCKFAQKQSIDRPTTCRLTFTRIVDPDARLSFLVETAEKEVSSSSSPEEKEGEGEERGEKGGETFIAPSCTCLDPGLEPCTADDIMEDWKTIREDFMSPTGLCSTDESFSPLALSIAEDDEANEYRKTPDSSVYVAFAGLGKFHCPLPGYRGVTDKDVFSFTKFSGPEALNDFCKNGLSYWKDPANPVVYARIPDCAKVVAKTPYGVEPAPEDTAACRDLCLKLKNTCTDQSPQESYNSCLIEPFETPEFTEKCTYMPKAEPKCEFSEWSEWSACTAT
ncbi:thrombospondin type 1 domain-containing protein, putative [Eimeria brunetti]|uniref:Thrombospondin type 1 domain-containing protein, putative n=1 Tax=Eimeria brunetti TaxID=51314 RepID=U6LKR3_9EIME|nr:thrombospondin type 1 domain-containing protein, putative [Eimeria brunetti]